MEGFVKEASESSLMLDLDENMELNLEKPKSRGFYRLLTPQCPRGSPLTSKIVWR